jgi:hypothetical protein
MNDLESLLKSHSEEIIYLDRNLNLKNGDNPNIVDEFIPRISYDLLSFKDNPKICFTSLVFLKEDFHIYFEKMIEVTQTKIGDLIDGNTNLDFKIYNGVNNKLKNLFFKALGSPKHVESIPSFGRIGLYNSADGGGKAPRIFFAIGHNSTLHILACDPEHDLFPERRGN